MLKNNIRVTLIEPGMAETEFSLVSFKGDKQRAGNVYKGFDALSAEDIAGVIYYCASLPEHLCINELEITPTQQASVNHSFRRE
jgi:NADP-dependent 3-hydroxy acid dehydrogenase YdfG